MILSDFGKALGQMGDGPFKRVLALGVGLSLLLLFLVYLAFSALVGWLVPDTITLPYIGEVGWLHTAAGWGSVVLMLVASVFLMVPVASAFTGLFLDDVAAAVEARHYPGAPPARRVGWAESLRESLGFLAVIVLVNLIALTAYIFAGPLAPLLFWAVNGILLGREYFQMAAARHLDRAAVADLRRRNRGQIWLAGMLMAAPLSLPLVNLVIPVLGAATFTHLFHRLARKRARLSS